MSEEEQHELFKKAFANTLRKLAEEPEELFDNDKLQKKYNNLLKEHIKLKQELQQKDKELEARKQLINKQDKELWTLEHITEEVREYIENKLWNYFDERNIYLKVRDEFLEILDKEVN